MRTSLAASWPSRLALSACTLLCTAVATPAQDLPQQETIVFGGSGGTAFRRDCPAHYVGTGLRGRADKFVDAVGLLCAPILSDGSVGPTTTSGTLSGGGGGKVYSTQCSPGYVMVAAELFASQITFTPSQWIYSGRIGCRAWNKATRTSGGSTSWLAEITNNNPGSFNGSVSCTSNRQPVVAIRGRSGTYVDALGLICNEP